MFYDEFKSLCDQYVPSAKYMSMRSFYPSIIKDENPPITMKAYGVPYDLYFNKGGVLTESIHFQEHYRHQRHLYYYDINKNLVKVIICDLPNQEIHTVLDIRYDIQKRIMHELMIVDGSDIISQNFHSYKDGWHITKMIDSTAKNACHFYRKYDSHGRVTENKGIREGKELINWGKTEFGQDGKILRQISLDENGNQDSVYEYYYNNDGKEEGYSYSGSVGYTPYKKRFLFEFNEEGDWISKTVLLNDTPQYFYERQILYH